MEEVEIVEYWCKDPSYYEVMLSEEFDKKQNGLPYKTLFESEQPPFVEFNPDSSTTWYGERKVRKLEEVKRIYGDFNPQ